MLTRPGSFDVLLRTSGRRLEREGFQVHGPQARELAAAILGAPTDLIVLERA